MRELVKIREVAGSVVVTLPQSILDPLGLKAGDRVLLEASPPRRIIITKEGATMPSTARLELEIELLEKRKRALESDLRYKGRQYNANMPSDEGMSDPDVAVLVLSGLERDRDRMDVDITEKKLELYDLQGGETGDMADSRTTRPANPAGEPEHEVGDETHAAQIFQAAAQLAGADGKKPFSRMSVRDHLGLNNREWQGGYTAIFQGMRDDHPGGAPPVGRDYSGVFHRTGQGTYELSEKGKRLANRTRQRGAASAE
jgi:antitoxin component of MazEF toxin-antitoxin module